LLNPQEAIDGISVASSSSDDQSESSIMLQFELGTHKPFNDSIILSSDEKNITTIITTDPPPSISSNSGTANLPSNSSITNGHRSASTCEESRKEEVNLPARSNSEKPSTLESSSKKSYAVSFSIPSPTSSPAVKFQDFLTPRENQSKYVIMSPKLASRSGDLLTPLKKQSSQLVFSSNSQLISSSSFISSNSSSSSSVVEPVVNVETTPTDQAHIFNPDDYELQFVEVMEIQESRELFLNFIQQFAIPETVSFLKDMYKYKEKRNSFYNSTTMKINEDITLETFSAFSFGMSSLKKSLGDLYKMAHEMYHLYLENGSQYQLNVSADIFQNVEKRWQSLFTYIRSFKESMLRSNSKTSMFTSATNHNFFDSDFDSIALSTDPIRVAPEEDDELSKFAAELELMDQNQSLNQSTTSLTSNTTSVNQSHNVDDESSYFVKSLAILTDWTLIQEKLLAIAQLFDSTEFYIYNDLAIEYFPRFKRSSELKNLLQSKGEDFTKKIAINIKLGYDFDLRFKSKDFITPSIQDRDIYFMIKLALGTSEWEFIKSARYGMNGKITKSKEETVSSYQAFISKSKYLVSDSASINMKLSKIVIDLPFSVEDSYKVIIDRK